MPAVRPAPFLPCLQPLTPAHSDQRGAGRGRRYARRRPQLLLRPGGLHRRHGRQLPGTETPPPPPGERLTGPQVVLPSGTVVDANADERADLFWALKGGSANFGIVARIDFRTLPSDGVWAGAQLFGGDQFEPAVAAMNRFLESGLGDPKAMLQFFFPAPGVLGVSMFYDGPGDRGDSPPSALAGFTALRPAKSTLAYTTCAAVGLASAGAQPNGLRFVPPTPC